MGNNDHSSIRFSDSQLLGASANDTLFAGEEQEKSSGLYDFEARLDNTLLGRLTTMDPMAEKYNDVSPYAYCAGNPVDLVDPDGRSTNVRYDPDIKKYKVVGGDAEDNDLSIYVVNDNMERLYKLGNSLTPYSFYNTDKKDGKEIGWMIGAEIDINDISGISFISSITKYPPPLLYYMANAVNGKKYDFKMTNGQKEVSHDKSLQIL